MELQSFKLFVTDTDVAALTTKLLEKNDAVENLKVRLTPEGVLVEGDYPTAFFKVHFETVWLLDAAGEVVAERRSDEGLLSLAREQFGDVLEGHLTQMGANASLPVVICGMAGVKP